MSAESEFLADSPKFVNNLYLFLFTKRNIKSFLSLSQQEFANSSHYQESIGEMVLFEWHKLRDHCSLHFRKFQPERARSESEFLECLQSCMKELKSDHIVPLITGMSAYLFEVSIHLVDSKRTRFIPLMHTAWIQTFRIHLMDRFLAEKAWRFFKWNSIRYSLKYELIAMRFPADYLFTPQDMDSFLNLRRMDKFRDFILSQQKLIQLFQHMKYELHKLCGCGLHENTKIFSYEMKMMNHRIMNTGGYSGPFRERRSSGLWIAALSAVHIPDCVAAGGPEKIAKYSRIIQDIGRFRYRGEILALYPSYMTDSSTRGIKSILMLFFEMLDQLDAVYSLPSSSTDENLLEQTAGREELDEARDDILDHSSRDVSVACTDDSQKSTAMEIN